MPSIITSRPLFHTFFFPGRIIIIETAINICHFLCFYWILKRKLEAVLDVGLIYQAQK